MRYLVTGGAGRLGRSVVAVLAEAGHDVVSVDVATGRGTVLSTGPTQFYGAGDR